MDGYERLNQIINSWVFNIKDVNVIAKI
jgi:hypothetical protein